MLGGWVCEGPGSQSNSVVCALEHHKYQLRPRIWEMGISTSHCWNSPRTCWRKRLQKFVIAVGNISLPERLLYSNPSSPKGTPCITYPNEDPPASACQNPTFCTPSPQICHGTCGVLARWKMRHWTYELRVQFKEIIEDIDGFNRPPIRHVLKYSLRLVWKSLI